MLETLDTAGEPAGFTEPRIPTKVLLVEDEPLLAEAHMAFLDDLDCEFTLAETGAQALAAIAADEPDVILLDLVLPDMNGLEIVRHVTAAELTGAVIVITSQASVNIAVEAMRAGAADFLVKPTSADRLVFTFRIPEALNKTLFVLLFRTKKLLINWVSSAGSGISSKTGEPVIKLAKMLPPKKSFSQLKPRVFNVLRLISAILTLRLTWVGVEIWMRLMTRCSTYSETTSLSSILTKSICWTIRWAKSASAGDWANPVRTITPLMLSTWIDALGKNFSSASWTRIRFWVTSIVAL